MPIYTYRCDNCEIKVEQMRSISSRDEATNCEECGNPLVRAVDRPGMVWAPTSTSGGHRT